MASLLERGITGKAYKMDIAQDRLEWLVLNDFLHNDVPYLMEYNSKIYYGPITEDNVIARRSA